MACYRGFKVIRSPIFSTYMYPSYQVLIRLDQLDEKTIVVAFFTNSVYGCTISHECFWDNPNFLCHILVLKKLSHWICFLNMMATLLPYNVTDLVHYFLTKSKNCILSLAEFSVFFTIYQYSLLETETLPSAKFLAECQKSGTRQRPSLPSAALSKELHSLGKHGHSAKDFFAECQTLGKISTLDIGCPWNGVRSRPSLLSACC